ncbi:hypothetical protein C900_04371 [Fulvivirga imtechensis AK7]|uniref:Lipocalin-like domain-containing protein n=1 Tax=Fulvivirga imtechensis AK7 TaxID=1237149 RepID=L8K0R8_9BACT|nr:hypothetical protein [Fulvivirga imtechensis]ELR73519.1 hypothetical protein C900_04371 [Fulvivirga imtechensis AK7]
MKNYLILICLLALLACDDNSDPIDDRQVTSASIKGSWNLEEYIDVDGAKHHTTYSIFVWYEQGFEFDGKNSFHPRYDPEQRFGADEWETDYLVGPGTYVVSGGVLTLSYNDRIYEG